MPVYICTADIQDILQIAFESRPMALKINLTTLPGHSLAPGPSARPSPTPGRSAPSRGPSAQSTPIINLFKTSYMKCNYMYMIPNRYAHMKPLIYHN